MHKLILKFIILSYCINIKRIMSVLKNHSKNTKNRNLKKLLILLQKLINLKAINKMVL
jgi:hypothetical protein